MRWGKNDAIPEFARQTHLPFAKTAGGVTWSVMKFKRPQTPLEVVWEASSEAESRGQIRKAWEIILGKDASSIETAAFDENDSARQDGYVPSSRASTKRASKQNAK